MSSDYDARASAISIRDRFESLLALGAGEFVRGIEISTSGPDEDVLFVGRPALDSDGVQDGWDKHVVRRHPAPGDACSCPHEPSAHEISQDQHGRRIARCMTLDCGCLYHAVRSYA